MTFATTERPDETNLTLDTSAEPSAGTTPSEIKTPVEARTAVVLEAGRLVAEADAAPTERHARAAKLVANGGLIVINIADLLPLLDERIASLRGANSEEGKAELAQYHHLKSELERFRAATVGVVIGNVPEEDAVEASTSFLGGICDWWSECHVQICSQTFTASIFLGCLGLCELAGVAPGLSAVLSGALIGGKAVPEALRAAAEMLKK